MAWRIPIGLITEAIDGVEMSSTGPARFAPLVRVLAAAWDVDEEQIGVKALAERKNFGNRIAEATRSRLSCLVLLAGMEADREAVSRSLVGKALHRFPALLLLLDADGGVRVEAQFIPEELGGAAWEGCDTITIPRRGLPVVARKTAADVRANIALVDKETTDSALLSQLETAVGGTSSDSPRVVLKRIHESKNLSNRIGEGLARRASVIVFRLPANLLPKAAEVVQSLRHIASTSLVFLIGESKTGLQVIEMRDDDNDTEVDGPNAPRQLELAETPGPDEPSYRRLERVKQLRQYLPLDAGADRLYEEHVDGDERLWYETKSLGFIQNLLGQHTRSVIVLTGNAGHGKTHMCRRILKDAAATDDVMLRLGKDRTGVEDWTTATASMPLRVVKDLSEINPPEAAAERLSELLTLTDRHVVVCANEGRLRDVVGRRATELRPLLAALEASLETGDTSTETNPDVHVVNLNHQAAAPNDSGFLDHVLDSFLNFKGAWKVCERCAARRDCPILANRSDLESSSSAPPENATHREALRELVRIAEEGGYVLTFRETLVLVAYVVTGGLTCDKVESMHVDGRTRKKLERYRLLQLLFEPTLSEDEADVMGILGRIHRLDPGRVALRPVDERLHQELEEQDQLGTGLFGDEAKQLHLRADLHREEERHRSRLRRARRAAWLASTNETDGVLRSSRLGLRHYDRFRALHEIESLDELQRNREILSTIRELVRGLHTIQGAVGVDSKTRFHLVDPAFGRSGSHAAVIARSLKINDLDLYTESQWWSKQKRKGTPSMLDAVEWLDRRLVLVDVSEHDVIVALDLLAFEFVLSAANGIVMRDFHSAERRRILRRLARHAEKRRDSPDEIRILLERGEGTLTVARDGTILMERNV